MGAIVVCRGSVGLRLFSVLCLLGLFRGPAALLAAEPSESVTQRLRLTAGWNLVAFYVEPESPGLRDVFAPLFSTGIAWEVWTYDNSSSPPQWQAYRMDEYGTQRRITAGAYGYNTFGGALPESYPPIRAGRGYWVLVNDSNAVAEYFVEVTGSLISGGVSLLPGWNLVGAFSPRPVKLDSMLTEELAQANLQVRTWSRNSSQAIPFAAGYPPGTLIEGGFHEADVIRPGCAYWVYVDLPREWGGPVLRTDAPETLALGTGIQGQTVSIWNDGLIGSTLTWTAGTDPADPNSSWIALNPAKGSVKTGQKGSFQVSVDWKKVPAALYGWKGGTLKTALVLDSDGGMLEVPVVLTIQEARGHYEGGITPQTVNGRSATLPNLRIALDLDPNDGRALLTAEQTPFFPDGVVFDCRVNGAEVTLWTSFFTDSDENGAARMFGGELVRTIRMTGTWTSDTVIEGTAIGDYVETLESPGANPITIRGTNPITIRGTFRLTRTGVLDPICNPSTGKPVYMTQRDDRDADGLPDDWEISYGLFTDANDAFRDDDRDGRVNIREYWDRTDPKRRESDPNLFVPAASISGVVVTDSNVPLEGIEILAYFGGDVYRTSTSSTGAFTFSGLSPGYYLLTTGSRPAYRFEPYLLPVALGRGKSELPERMTASPVPASAGPAASVPPSQSEHYRLTPGDVTYRGDLYRLRSEHVHLSISKW